MKRPPRRSRPTRVDDAVTGFIAGVIATVPMTLFMLGARSLLPRRQRYAPPPERLIRQSEKAVGLAPSRHDNNFSLLGLIGHHLYGGVTGAIYGLKPHSGPLFGAVVWAGSYLGWLRAVPRFRSVTREPIRRKLLQVAAHFVWGAALEATFDALQLSPRPARRPSSRR